MTKTNVTALKIASLNRIINLLEKFLHDNGTINTQHRKRAQNALKEYQTTLLIIEKEFKETGGELVGNSKTDN